MLKTGQQRHHRPHGPPWDKPKTRHLQTPQIHRRQPPHGLLGCHHVQDSFPWQRGWLMRVYLLSSSNHACRRIFRSSCPIHWLSHNSRTSLSLRQILTILPCPQRVLSVSGLIFFWSRMSVRILKHQPQTPKIGQAERILGTRLRTLVPFHSNKFSGRKACTESFDASSEITPDVIVALAGLWRPLITFENPRILRTMHR